MSASLSNAANAEPNLTPILDMVFQLITFFMLVINFKSAALDEKLSLPVWGSARPVDAKGADLLVLNVRKNGNLVILNRPTDLARYIPLEAESSRLLARRKFGKELQPGDELPTTVVIRADEATPFRLLNKVITTCQDNGFRKFALKALNKKPEPKDKKS